MEQKLTNEEIAKVFAMYLGQYVVHDDGEIAHLVGVVDTSAHLIHLDTNSYGTGNIDYVKLLLTPLSSITDEHATDLAKVACEHWDDSCRVSYIGYAKGGLGHNIHESVYCIIIERFIPCPGAERFYKSAMLQIDFEDNLFLMCDYQDDGRVLIDDASEKLFYAYEYARMKGYAVPLFFGIDHACNGKTAIELGIAINNSKTVEK